MSDTASLIAAARGVGDLIEERFRELEAHVGSVLTRMSDLELDHKATLRRVEHLESRVVRLEAMLGGSDATEAGS